MYFTTGRSHETAPPSGGKTNKRLHVHVFTICLKLTTVTVHKKYTIRFKRVVREQRILENKNKRLTLVNHTNSWWNID